MRSRGGRPGIVAWAAVLMLGAWPAAAEVGALPEPALQDPSPSATPRRAHPPKKRGFWRIERTVEDSDDELDRFRKWLGEHDTLVGFDVAFYDQYASRVRKGGNNAATFAWQLFVDYEIVSWKEYGALHATGTFLGTIGADYDPAAEPLSDRIGSISIVNGNVYPDGVAFDELYLHFVTPDAKAVLAIGKIDMSYFFDTNRAANDAYRQFTAFALENDISIPFPLYGGFGAIGRWNATDDLYVMFGAGDASSDERIPWGSVADGAWWELLEVGIELEPDLLGTGNYRLTGWHSDAGPGSGFGIGLNLDQNLGTKSLIGFFRAGFGDPSQTNVDTTISGGVSFPRPFGRDDDEAGVGFSWAKPAGGDRNEKFAETYYRWAITSRLSISPALQIVVDPSDSPEDDVSVIGEIRLLWML